MIRAIGLFFCVGVLWGCRATPIVPSSIASVRETRAVFPPDYTAAFVMPADRVKRLHKIENRYGKTLWVLKEGLVFKKAVIHILRDTFGEGAPLTEKTKANIVVVVNGELNINTFAGSYETEVEIAIFRPDGELIGIAKEQGYEETGTVNDETGIYNSYLRSLNTAIQRILNKYPKIRQAMAEFPRERILGGGWGTGFFVNRNGDALTSAHVIDGCDRITAVIGTTTYQGTVKFSDKSLDLAVVNFAYQPNSVVSLSMSSQIQIGEEILTMGFPVQLTKVNTSTQREQPSLTDGVISSVADAQHLFFTAPIQPGNSGSPLIDSHGHIIGVVDSTTDTESFIKKTGTLPQNINRAIRISAIAQMLKQRQIEFSEASMPSAPVSQPSKKDIAQMVTPALVRIICDN